MQPKLYFHGILILICLLFPLQTVAGDNQGNVVDAGVRTVAIWDFDNNTVPGLGDPTVQDFLKRIMPEIIATQLSNVPGIKLVERVHLRELLQEQKLSSSQLADQKSRINLGRISGAKYMIFGSFMSIGDTLQLTTRVVEVETSLITFSETISGNIKTSNTMMEKSSNDIAKSFSSGDFLLLRYGSNMDQSIWAQQDLGLSLIDKGKYLDAKKVFASILKKEPNFLPAERQMKMAILGSEFSSGLKHLENRNYIDAVAIFKSILKKDKHFIPARKKLKLALKMKRTAQ
jgi:TolB-like protein